MHEGLCESLPPTLMSMLNAPYMVQYSIALYLVLMVLLMGCL
uniref:Uncharacterized protein n=1 Tax=Rhizophora mucronata TaxID=61149 RepID=A0A2P2N981_RHIMU